MDSQVVLLALRLALLVGLWLLVAVALRSMSRSYAAAAGPAGALRRSRPASRAGGVAPALVITNGPLAGSRMDLAGLSTVTLGRGQECTVTLPDDFASTSHARVFTTPGGWYVEDLASRNGTFVAGRRISEPEPLAVGAEIRVGQTCVRLEA